MDANSAACSADGPGRVFYSIAKKARLQQDVHAAEETIKFKTSSVNELKEKSRSEMHDLNMLNDGLRTDLGQLVQELREVHELQRAERRAQLAQRAAFAAAGGTQQGGVEAQLRLDRIPCEVLVVVEQRLTNLISSVCNAS
eukprot:TRINITY_DN17752_c0_g1_i1.p1 TRINITY_DN17752_c0_g1~~TRINITY_DN17752_c0_g1_i1.p1  ORF type:complete len:141 (+),score=39.59 TRINITY_DN17752_c0_g1_i1:76-498(+)